MTIKIGEIALMYGLVINPAVADKDMTLALQLKMHMLIIRPYM